MKDKDFMEIWLEVTDAEIVDKLEILHLERGIQYSQFVQQAIAEKLMREGYLHGGVKQHKTKSNTDRLSGVERLRKSFMEYDMRKR